MGHNVDSCPLPSVVCDQAIAGLGDTAHFCLVLACLAAVLGTCWWKLDYGLGVVRKPPPP